MTGRMCWFGWRVRRRSDFRALSLRDGEKEKNEPSSQPGCHRTSTAPGPACQRRDRDRGDRAQKGWVGRGVLARRETRLTLPMWM